MTPLERVIFDDPDSQPDVEQSETIDKPKGPITPYYEFLNGLGGSGKSFRIRQLQAVDPLYGITSASTGIASVNMDCITINSLLGYFDTQSLRDAYIDGRLHRMMLKAYKDGHKNLIIDEISMVDGDQLDIIVDTLEHLQENVIKERQIGLIVVGDFGQLPVVKGKWAFDAQCWQRCFEPNTIKLTKNWRADGDPLFVEFLAKYRLGDGIGAVDFLRANLSADRMEALFASGLDTSFQGTSIMGTNAEVGRYNQIVLQGCKGRAFTVNSERRGKLLTQWGQNKLTKEWGIQPKMDLKIGAYIMLLSNQRDADGQLEFSNGDCGHIIDYVDDGANPTLTVKLVRNGELVYVQKLTRYAYANDSPSYALPDDYEPSFDKWLKRWRIGQIEYFPCRLAYASTVHKVQALTLDRIQIDLRQAFMGANHMGYVALSRCRSLAGLRIVGSLDLLQKRCRVDPRVVRFL